MQDLDKVDQKVDDLGASELQNTVDQLKLEPGEKRLAVVGQWLRLSWQNNCFRSKGP